MHKVVRTRRWPTTLLPALGASIAAAALLLVLPAFANDAPTNGLIAYAGGGGTENVNQLYFDIYLANPDGSGDTVIVRHNSDTFAIEPTFSADGNRIAYSRGATGLDAGIWVANADGTDQTRIFAAAHAFTPTWSEDGSTIWFYVSQNGAAPGIYRVDPDGSNLVRVTDKPVDQHPAPSPDGNRVAFVGAEPDGWGIYVMNTDGTNRTRIVDDTQLYWNSFREPDWSPDGSSIVFSAYVDFIPGPGLCSGFSTLPRDLYIVAPDGTGLTNLTNTPGWEGPHEEGPRFSPDGTQVAFVAVSQSCENGSNTFDNRQVYVRNVDGSGSTTQISDFGGVLGRAVGRPGWQSCTAATELCAFVAPGPPTDVQAYAADGSAFVAWEPPADSGGATLTGFRVTASPGGTTVETDAYSITAAVHGLSNGISYTFSVNAVNNIDVGPGVTSNAVTPGAGLAPAGPNLQGLVTYNVGSSIRMMNADGSENGPIGQSGYWPTWAPDGNSILFASGGRIYAADPDGSNKYLVSNHPDATADGARWSPDGTKILHWDWLRGMWILDPQTFIPTQINSVETAVNGAWSPDGTKIAYTAALPDGWGIYVMNADGSDPTRILDTNTNFGPIPQSTWTSGDGLDWSPDGEWLVFQVRGPQIDPPLGLQCFSSVRNEDLWMIRPNGTGLRKLTNTSTWFGPHEQTPRFTPDGSAVIYAAHTYDCVNASAVNNPTQIHTINLTGVGTNQLTSGTSWATSPALQPCGPGTTECGTEPPPPPGSLKCQGLTATIQGDSGNNILEGTPFDDVIHGGDGNDEINGNGGNDIICGGNGDDVLIGGDGDDTLLGGPGNDEMSGDAGNDLIRGQQGSDVSYGGFGDDRIQDGSGNDELHGDDGKDKMWGGIGIDVLMGGGGNDQLHGGRDDDTLYGENGTDRVWGDSGNDLLFGNDKSDFLYGGINVDTMYGGVGNDRLFGWTGNDFLYGEAGRDQLRGQDGDDLVDGGPASDFCSIETIWLNCEIPI